MVPSDESQTDVCSNQPSFFKQDTQQGLGMFVMLIGAIQRVPLNNSRYPGRMIYFTGRD